jgi:hypothetical protein
MAPYLIPKHVERGPRPFDDGSVLVWILRLLLISDDYDYVLRKEQPLFESALMKGEPLFRSVVKSDLQFAAAQKQRSWIQGIMSCAKLRFLQRLNVRHFVLYRAGSLMKPMMIPMSFLFSHKK